MRKESWDIDLITFIRSREKTPFEWGSHDCTMFAVDCAKAITGVDLARKYRGYKTREGADTIISTAGSLRELVTSNIGPEISPKMASRGDWVLIECDGQQALSVCLGIMAIAAGENGLSMRPMKDAITAWRID